MIKPKKMFHNQAVMNALSLFASGASIDQIEANLAVAPTRRTLQRWLIYLIDSGLVHRTGLGRATNYVVAKQFNHLTFLSEPTALYGANTRHEASIPLSRDVKEIEAYVRHPLAQRNNVGYNPSFLEIYQPNETFYLPDPIRKELLQNGQVTHHI